ncbi:MAG TPA: SDR family oxidoreductase [Bryobacteraceae bacterium]|nr:SDR family oxidoreductase [Bryobacteraceae bacterium]
MDIRGKAVVVTGAGADGSGRAIALRFAREGALVVVSDIDEAGGHETVRLIESAGGRAAFCPADVRKEEQVRNLLGFAEKTFGGLAVLVNNASGPDIVPGEPLEHWTDNFPTDVFGTMYGTRLAIDALRRGGGGAIVNMTSITGLWHGRKNPVPGYDLAKAAVIRLTTALAWLGPKENIRVNCLAPGWIASQHVRTYWESLTPEQRQERNVPARLLSLDEVAAAVFRLATDDALAGRVLVWWSEDSPGLIPANDRGYAALESVAI